MYDARLDRPRQAINIPMPVKYATISGCVPSVKPHF
jgi:hypothetical protein